LKSIYFGQRGLTCLTVENKSMARRKGSGVWLPPGGASPAYYAPAAGESIVLGSESATVQITGSVETEAATATAPGSGFDAATIKSYISEINGEVVTTLIVDIGGGSIVSSGDADDVIGEDGASAAYLTRITTAINGFVHRGEIICIETPTTGDSDIDLCADTDGTVAEDVGGMDHVLVNGGTWRVGPSVVFTIPATGIQNDYLYLAHGGTTAGTYDAGQFMIKLYGVSSSALLS